MGGSSPSMSHCLNGQNRGCTMGYSMMTRSGVNLYRYTEWVGFAGPSANFRPDWDTLVATELYNHTVDAAENDNVAARHSGLTAELSKLLRSLSDPQSAQRHVRQ